MEEKLVLVDSTGRMTGTMEKMAVHRSGALHRAFSIFIFNTEGELLLQRRALEKYHSGGLWTNTCCGHPRIGESTAAAAKRRLMEEMGLACELKEVFRFTYRHEFTNGLIEHEFDHVWIGFSDDLAAPDPLEAMDWRYADTETLARDLNEHPDHYTHWLGICFQQVIDLLRNEPG